MLKRQVDFWLKVDQAVLNDVAMHRTLTTVCNKVSVSHSMPLEQQRVGFTRLFLGNVGSNHYRGVDIFKIDDIAKRNGLSVGMAAGIRS